MTVMLAGGGFWSCQRLNVAEEKKRAEDEVRRETLARDGRRERAWRTAREILAATDRVLPSLTDSEIWRAAQWDVARDRKASFAEMLPELERAFQESKSMAEGAPSSLAWLMAGDIGFALYRLPEARACYDGAINAPDARRSPFELQAKERAAELLHESGACGQEVLYWKFAALTGGVGGGPDQVVKAAIRVGRCSQALRLETESIGALHHALAVAESQGGHEGREVIAPLGRLLAALTVFSRFPEAAPAARRHLALSEKHFGSESYGVALSLLLECQLLSAQNRWPELIAASSRASRILESTVGEGHPASLEMQRAIGMALLESNRAAESEAVYRALLEKVEKFLPHDHFLAGSVTGQLAHAVSRQDRKTEAEGLYRGAIDIIEHSPVALRSHAADYQASLGQMLASLHRTAEAETLLRQALASVTTAGDGPRQARVCLWLAELLRNSGRTAEAGEMTERSGKALANQPGPSSNEDRVLLLVSRSDALKNARQFGEAEAALREAVAIGEASLPADSVTFAIVLNNLGLLLMETGRETEADRHLRRSLEIHIKAQGADHNMVADTALNLAGIAHSRGQSEEALRLSRRALEIYEVSYGKTHPRVAITLNNLAYFLRELGRYDEAENTQRRCVSVAETCFGPDSPEVGVRLRFLATILQSAGREKDAEPILRRVESIAAKVSPRPSGPR